MSEEMLTNEEPKVIKKGLATGALVLGILALLTTLILINYILGLIGLILAIVYLAKKGAKPAKGRAIAGLICAAASILISTCLYGGIYIYITQSSITDIMDDVNRLTGGQINMEEMINETINSSIPDQTAIKQILGKEINYDTICEFVGKEVSIQTITNFIGKGIDPNECTALISEVDFNSVMNDLGGELTYKALEDKVGKDFTYEELKEYLEDFKKVE